MGKVEDAAARLSTAIENLELSVGAQGAQQLTEALSYVQNGKFDALGELDAQLAAIESSIDESIEELESLLSSGET